MLSLSINCLSVVIPFHNEADSIDDLVNELLSIIPQICDPSGIRWEIILVDDGSNDETLSILQSIGREERIQIITLSPRLGQSAALWAGFRVATGDVIITMDGDGQNDPADIEKLLIAIEGCDMVVGNRRIRQDTLRKRLFSRFGNLLRNSLTGSQLPDSGCGLKVFRRSVMATILPFHGLHRFIPILIEISGGRVLAVDVHHRPRLAGKSKYGILDRLFLPLLDCLALAWLKRRRLPSDFFSMLDKTTTNPIYTSRRIEVIQSLNHESATPCFLSNCRSKESPYSLAASNNWRKPQA
jgi:dolichol-phosphate mannosyltransferase